MEKKNESRYFAIHQTLKNKKDAPYTLEALKKAIFKLTKQRVADRTLKLDLATLKKDPYLAPIKNKKGSGYYYNNDSFELLGRSFTKAELEILYIAYEIVSQLGNNELDKSLKELIQKISPFSKPKRSIFLDLPLGRGTDNFNALNTFIRSKKAIQFNYLRHQESVNKWQIVSPLALKQCERIWYLVGYKHESGEIKQYGIDRIANLSQGKIQYHCPEDFDVEKYFKNSFGITVKNPELPETLKLKVHSPFHQYFQNWPFHKSQQQLEYNHKFAIYQYELYLGSEVIKAVLGLCQAIEVLEPIHFKETVLSQLKKGIEINGAFNETHQSG